MRRLFRNLALYAFHIGFVRPVLRWAVGTRYRRRGLLPEGPCLVVSNHNSHLDAAILMTLFPLRRLPKVHPVAAADYFGDTWLKRTLALVLMNGIPIERHPTRGNDPLAPIVAALERGDSLIFFPEGSRGEAGVVAPFRSGVGRLVRKLPGLLVVPVFMSGPERIWARGQVVPVPSNIDAVVGKPRTYSAELEARVIAEQVREDVLAVAPTPPPMPSKRPEPPVRVAICGLHQSTRKSLFRQVVGRLAHEGKTHGVSSVLVTAQGDEIHEITGPIPVAPGPTWVGLLSKIFRTGGLFKGEKFVSMVHRAQVDEFFGQGSGSFLVTDGSALVDLMAWAVADFYKDTFDEAGLGHLLQFLSGQKQIPAGNWWSFIRRAPEVWLVNTFSLARPPVPDVLVVVTTPIEKVLESIRATGEERQEFQSEEFLRELEQAYRQVAGLLRKRGRVLLIEAEIADPTDPGEMETLVDEIVDSTLTRVERPASTG